jgi:signal transduction histidine kinase/ActR/RegA family two-component response regulator
MESRRSVRAKLMGLVLVTTALAVCLAGTAMMAYDLSVFRRSWTGDLSSQGSILAVAVAPALEFGDHDVADRNLSAMSARPGILVAALYTADGRLYASYTRDPGILPPASAPPHGRRVAGERVELSQPVVRKRATLGTLYLLAHYDVRGRLEAYLGIFVLVMASSLAVAHVLSRRLQRAITEPLDAMTGVARQIVSRRDYSLRAAKTTDDEIGLAVLAFNGMLNEVEAREAALLEADRRKDEFLATLAHELRNPLAPIRHAVKLLDADSASQQQRQWGRSVIGRQVQRMALLLDDLLDVSRITRGQLDLKIDRVELRSLVDAALEVARPLIDTKNQQLILELPQQRITVAGDSLRLSQSLSNLLSNAAKYTDPGGKITLTIELTASELKLTVRDSGIGIEAAAVRGLFQIFSQLDSAIDRAEGGLGIGLALVKGLVELHGGRVTVDSGGPGLGSEFSIYLPRSRITIETENPRLPEPREPARGTAGCTVLMADDNRDAVDSLAMLLQMSGYEVRVAYTGREALALAEQHRPDIVLLDIGMPDMNGYDTARGIRKLPTGRSIYLVAITGWGQLDDKEKAAAAGFDHHLTKPVDPDKVCTLLDAWVTHHARDRA